MATRRPKPIVFQDGPLKGQRTYSPSVGQDRTFTIGEPQQFSEQMRVHRYRVEGQQAWFVETLGETRVPIGTSTADYDGGQRVMREL